MIMYSCCHTTSFDKTNQRVSSTGDGKSEDFLWDGLALIHRGETFFINEPYVTGGNPVMAGDEVLFNDMLGSTLAVNGKAVEMSSFGETADKNAFFTGKPMIDELGYSFLFRDYNPNQGKWTTTDPLGYPDGWNNLAYCNNGVTLFVDWLGGIIAYNKNSEDGVCITAAIAKISSTPTGKAMIDYLEKSRKIHLIVTTTGGSECFNDPFCPDNAFNGVGCSTTVLWNPSQTNVDNWQSDSWVALAHELYHSKDADNGSWSYARDQVSGIYYDEIEACREANRMVLENNPDAVTRTQYAEKMLPSDAIRPVPLKHQE